MGHPSCINVCDIILRNRLSPVKDSTKPLSASDICEKILKNPRLFHDEDSSPSLFLASFPRLWYAYPNNNGK